MITENTAKVVRGFINKSLASANARGLALEALAADGVESYMLKAPKKEDNHKATFDTIKAIVVSGFPSAVQSLLHKDIDTLSGPRGKGVKANKDGEETEQRLYWQQQIGSKMKDLRQGLEKREKPEGETEGEGEGEGSTATWESRTRETLSKILKQCEKKEASTIADMARFMDSIKTAIALIK